MRPFTAAAYLLIGTVSSFSIIEKSQGQGCVELQCPATAFDYGVKSIVNDVTLSSEQCSTCKQCTDNGYSICLRLRNSRASRQAAGYPGGCSCAHSVPANCHNQLSQTNHPANISMRLYTVCYADSMQAPPKPLAVNEKASVIVTVEPFWHEPYWRELQPSNITLFYEFVVKAPEHCEQEVKTSPRGEHLCISHVAVSLNGDGGEKANKALEKNAEYDHSDNYDQYDDDLPPEVQFDRDVFAGAKNLKTYYTVNVRRPRQLVIGQRGGDPFRDLDSSLTSEKLEFNLKPEVFETNFDEKSGSSESKSPPSRKPSIVSPTSATENDEKEEPEAEDDEKPVIPDASEEDTEAESQEHGEAGTDFFDDGTKKKVDEEDDDDAVEVNLSDVKPVKSSERKSGNKEKIVEPPIDEDEDDSQEQEKEEAEEEEKIENEDDAEASKEEEKEESTTPEASEEAKDEEKDVDKDDAAVEGSNEETTTEANETTEEPKESQESDDGDNEEETTTEEIPEETTPMEDEQEASKETDGENVESEEASADGEATELDDDELEKLSFYERLMKDKYHLARVIFGITIGACLLLILCTLLYRKRCCCKKSKTKTSNGYHYANANQHNTELVSHEKELLNQ